MATSIDLGEVLRLTGEGATLVEVLMQKGNVDTILVMAASGKRPRT